MMTEDGAPSVNPKLDNMGEMLKTIHDLNERNKALEKRLTKAIDLLKWALHSDPEHDEDFEKKWGEAEWFRVHTDIKF